MIVSPLIGQYGNPTLFTAQGDLTTDGIQLVLVDQNDASCRFVFEFDPQTCSDECFIQEIGLVDVFCSDNGTPRLDAKEDDRIGFVLDPKGFNLGGRYMVTTSDGTLVEPPTGEYGQETTFFLAPGSASGQYLVEIMVTDTSDPDCVAVGGLPTVDPCSDQPIPTVANELVTPNLPGAIFKIEGLEPYKNQVTIYNRNGIKVFETIDYDNRANYFHGRANTDLVVRSGENLPFGVYFYVITYQDGNVQRTVNGYLQVND